MKNMLNQSLMRKEEAFIYILNKAVDNNYLRKPIVKFLDRYMHKKMTGDKLILNTVQEKKYEFLSAMLHAASRNLEKGYIKKEVAKKIINTLVRNSLLDNNKIKIIKEDFNSKYKIYPPNFIVLSPTQFCNLRCLGCYASSEAKLTAKLPYDVVDRIVGEANNLFGDRFMTISGGEPFLYKDEGKTLFDIWEKYSNMFFLVYTNGTQITKEVAERLAKLGNVTPAISVEGFEKETDYRRGKGIYKKILQAFENLRNAGVPFGISVTATNKNVDVLLNDGFYDFYFNKQGASYMWQFQLMPIGRAVDRTLMLKPEQRVKLYKQWEKMLKKKYCIADFWNSAVLSNGCIAYGRKGGYFYIDWNGKIMPCVFVPFYVDNVKDIYSKNGTLADALFSKFFENGRAWQEEYGLKDMKHPNNLLMPCSIRDHYKYFRENIMTKEVKPEDKAAEESLKSKEYLKELDKFDKELEVLTIPIWKKNYLKK